jgi:type I restriction enzyme, S subunit
MGDWIETTIGAQAALQRGFDITKAQQRPGSVPVVSSGGVTSWHDEAMVEGPGVILGRKGVVGSVHRVKGSYWPHDTTLWVKDFHGNNRTFVYYFFRWLAPQLAAMDVGSANPTLNRNHVHPIKVRWPSLALQARISSLLESLDDKIELNRQTNETLEALARAIFKDWFVDFGPTRAKAEGRSPYLAPALWDLFPDRLDAEGKPEGWDVASLSDIADLNPESWTKRNAPEAVDYVDLSNTNWGTIEKTETHAWESAPSRARRILKPGDTIVGTVRPGNGSYAFIAQNGLTGSTGFAVLRPKSPRDRELVWLAVTAPENIERLAFLADGAAYPAVRPDVVANTEIVLPEPRVINAFSDSCGGLLDRIESHKAESRTLAQTRDLLLPKLMSGEVRLRDAEQALRY